MRRMGLGDQPVGRPPPIVRRQREQDARRRMKIARQNPAHQASKSSRAKGPGPKLAEICATASRAGPESPSSPRIAAL